MAKRSGTKKAGQFTFEVISEEQANEELSTLRSGKGGRASKYEPLAAEAQKISGDKVLKVKLGKNEVGGLRGYLRRRFGEKYTVKSSKIDGDDYMAFVLLTPDEAKGK